MVSRGKNKRSHVHFCFDGVKFDKYDKFLTKQAIKHEDLRINVSPRRPSQKVIHILNENKTG